MIRMVASLNHVTETQDFVLLPLTHVMMATSAQQILARASMELLCAPIFSLIATLMESVDIHVLKELVFMMRLIVMTRMHAQTIL